MGDQSERAFRDWVADTATVIVAILAVLLAGSIVLQAASEIARERRTATGDRRVDNWRELTNGGHRIGPADAAVVVVAFMDYECPFCRRAERVFRTLRKTYPNDVAVVYRHFPLPSHQNAYVAARFAECAAEQNRFESALEILSNAVELSSLSGPSFARAADIADSTAFLACIEGSGGVARIEADLVLARNLGVHGVPAVIIDGTLLGSAPDSARLFDWVRQRLREARR